MPYGLETYDEQGRPVITTFTPYNLVKVLPLTSQGSHSVIIDQGVGSTIVYWVEYNVPSSPDLNFVVSNVLLNGNTLTYDVVSVEAPFARKGVVYFALRR